MTASAVPSHDADTIVAVASPAGRGPRGILRMSGPDALSCARERFEPLPPGAGWTRAYRATPGRLRLIGPGVRAPAVAYVMRAPRSYTREDVVEFHVPGSPALLELALEDVVAHGPGALRPAEPGEFTRRAFMNGRLDLAQAEAVLSVIRARSEAELLAAARRLGGSVTRRCERLGESVAGLRVRAEAALDFAEHGVELMGQSEFVAQCEALCTELREHARSGRGELAGDGTVHVVVCGPPNAGKSSLLNRLGGAEHALVHRRPGTTRDAVSAEVELGGASFRLTDTAGLEESSDGPGAEAVRRSRGLVGACQLLVVVLDGSRPASEPEVAALRAAAEVPRERVLCAVNKADLPRVLDDEALGLAQRAYEVIPTSALTGQGVDLLREALWRTVAQGRLDASAADCHFNARQRLALRRAGQEVAVAARAVEEGLGYEFAAVNLREASDALGRVTGRVTSQDVLSRIFNQFCIGK